jgi:hypothetical protein
MDSNVLFFLAGLAAPLVLLVAMPRLWRQILSGFFLFACLLFTFAGFFPLLVLLLIGLIAGLIAASKQHSFLIWWAYGTVLPIVAIPHALMLKKPDDGPPPRETYA